MRGCSWRVKRRLLLGAPAVLLLAGCRRSDNSLEPSSHQARDIASLFLWMMGAAWIGLAAVVALLLLSRIRANRRGIGRDTEGDKPGERPGWYVVVGAGIVLPIVLISTLFVISDIFVIRTTEAPAKADTKLTVRVIGHDWWWEVRYPGTSAVTANEIHIPVHTPVRVEVRSADVIHSFWVPELNRKIDANPGMTNAVELDTDRAGHYRGQCSEFCGLQHAHMGMYVIAEPAGKFRRWLATEEKPAAAPTDALARRGFREFERGACSSCHAIRGTSATSHVGPDLTHVAGRSTLAGATIADDPHNLGDWIARSQSIKPGNEMPDIRLSDTQLRALVAYLRGLK